MRYSGHSLIADISKSSKAAEINACPHEITITGEEDDACGPAPCRSMMVAQERAVY